jgi:hypothetical protein
VSIVSDIVFGQAGGVTHLPWSRLVPARDYGKVNTIVSGSKYWGGTVDQVYDPIGGMSPAELKKYQGARRPDSGRARRKRFLFQAAGFISHFSVTGGVRAIPLTGWSKFWTSLGATGAFELGTTGRLGPYAGAFATGGIWGSVSNIGLAAGNEVYQYYKETTTTWWYRAGMWLARLAWHIGPGLPGNVQSVIDDPNFDPTWLLTSP